MEIALVGIVALLASLLTFFSGFGLGTILTPVFILFMPTEMAIAATGIVHLLNNIFKWLLTRRDANYKIVFMFGIPAILGAFLGAKLLIKIADVDFSISYSLLGLKANPAIVNVVIGVLILLFALFELVPKLRNLEFPKSWLTPGGFVSGFFGGLSGHQGALRTAFLIRYGLSKEQFIATGIVIACIIDVIRLSTYSTSFSTEHLEANLSSIIVGTLCAMVGAIVGKFLLKKVTMKFVQLTVGILMIVLGLLLISGIIE